MVEGPRADLDEVATALDVSSERGVWAVRSSSRTVYYLDLDAGLITRARARSSAAFAFDDEWVPLVRVTSRHESLGVVTSGRLRVGERPQYLTDPRGGAGDYQWRVQRVVTSIERVTPDEVPALRRHTGTHTGGSGGGDG